MLDTDSNKAFSSRLVMRAEVRHVDDIGVAVLGGDKKTPCLKDQLLFI